MGILRNKFQTASKASLPLKRFLPCLLFLLATTAASAQDVADSAWLRRARSGELKLNEATLRAISTGTLLTPPSAVAAPALRHSPADLPLIKTFDSIRPTVRPELLPPAVYKLYEPADLNRNGAMRLPAAGSCLFSPAETDRLRELRYLGMHRACGGAPGMLPAGVSFSVSFEDMLRYVFWPSHRAKLRNRRHAQAYKNYSFIRPAETNSQVESERRRRNGVINEMRGDQ